MYQGPRCISVPNVEFPCSNLCLGEVCTDADANDDAQRTKHDCVDSLVFIPNEPIKYITTAI